jgi:hypothetical protein
MSCPICDKRPPKRFCPAKGEKICAICCGQEREVTIDCPVNCPHLVAARRYESGHRKPLSPDDFPYRDVEFPVDFVYEHWPVVAGFSATILQFHGQEKSLNDADALAALGALAETTRTLTTGIYYERPPDAPLPRALYGRLVEFLQDYKKQQAERAGLATLKDAEVFHLLVFLLRIGKQRTNGRPRSRAFLDFLRARFPLPSGAAKEEPRIIVP